jgi:hypothetical protein
MVAGFIVYTNIYKKEFTSFQPGYGLSKSLFSLSPIKWNSFDLGKSKSQ